MGVRPGGRRRESELNCDPTLVVIQLWLQRLVEEQEDSAMAHSSDIFNLSVLIIERTYTIFKIRQALEVLTRHNK